MFDHRSPDPTQASDLSQPYVRIRAPDDEVHPRIVQQGLINAVNKLFSSQLDVDQVEYLTFPTDGEQVYLLGANIATVPDRSANVGQQKLSSLSDQSDPATGSLLDGAQVAMEKLSEQIPVSVDIEPVRLDFGPLGQSAVTTSRFATQENVRIPQREGLDPCVHTLLAALADEPYIYQVLISKYDRTEYKVACRVALFDPTHQVKDRSTLKEIVRNGRDFYPVRFFDNLELSSNLERADAELRVGSYNQIERTTWSSPPNTQELIDLATGVPEYRDLTRGRIDYARAYNQLDLVPSFLIRQRDLEFFLTLSSISREGNPWETVAGRSHPDMIPIDLDNPVSAVEQSDIPAQPSPSSPKDGTSKHWGTVKLVAQINEERGHDVHIVDQTEGESINDVWVDRANDDLLILEITNTSTSKPSGVLKNVIRAEQWGYDVRMIGVDKETARQVANILHTPFSDTRSDRTLLYTHNEVVSTPDGATRLLPQDETQAHWWLTPDGDLELRDAADTVLGRHDATKPLQDADLETPRYYRDGGTYVVETADGDIINRYQSKEALLAEWTQLHKPLVPTQLTYIDKIPIKYVPQNGDEIKPYRPSAEWDIPAHSKRYKEALEQYFELFTCTVTDDKLPVPTVREHARSVMASLSEHKTPDNEWFGRREPETLQKDEMTGQEQTQHYRELTWRYPRGLVSPTLPAFDQPTYPDAWDDEPA